MRLHLGFLLNSAGVSLYEAENGVICPNDLAIMSCGDQKNLFFLSGQRLFLS